MFLFTTPASREPQATSAVERGVSNVRDAIASAARATGVGFDYLLRTAQRESSLSPTAQATTSSARGLYQFIDQTWLTMVRDEGRRFGLDRYAEAIQRGSDGRAVVGDATVRREILSLRDDPTTSALMAGAFTRRNAQDLKSAIGRDPTEGELYMAHFLGSGGAARLIGARDSTPDASAAAAFPEAAAANRRIFFDRGRPRSVSEVYNVLARGANGQATVAAAAPVAPTQSQTQSVTSTAAAPQTTVDFGSWGAVRRVNADPARPFHSMFSGQGGPINAFVAATWGAFGSAAARGGGETTQTAQAASGASGVATASRTTNAAPAGGPYLPLIGSRGPLDLSQFRRGG